MQLVLVRHAQPHRISAAVTADAVTAEAVVADPGLTEVGIEQAQRVPPVLARMIAGTDRITRVLSSPQRRARDTAAPTAAALGLNVEVVEGLAEYDRELPHYIPIEDARTEFRATYDRIKAGYLPEQIDGPAFAARVLAATADIAAGSGSADTVVAFAHGGVINILLQDVLELPRPLTFPIDYCSITRVLYSRSGTRTVATVNENAHVRELLPRHRRQP